MERTVKEFGRRLRKKNDRKLYSNVDICTKEDEKDVLYLLGHIEDWSLAKYELDTNKFEEIEIEGNISSKHTCFYEGKFICADTYDISTIDVKTGRQEELWSSYDEKEALAEVTCIYVTNNKIYYGSKALSKENDSMTGLWYMNLDGSNNKKLSSQEVYEICFVGTECVVVN